MALNSTSASSSTQSLISVEYPCIHLELRGRGGREGREGREGGKGEGEEERRRGRRGRGGRGGEEGEGGEGGEGGEKTEGGEGEEGGEEGEGEEGEGRGRKKRGRERENIYNTPLMEPAVAKTWKISISGIHYVDHNIKCPQRRPSSCVV